MPERRPRRDQSGSGRVPFVWVTDDDTGHRYDVPQDAIRPGMTPVEGYDLNYSSRARRTKYRTDLGNEPAEPTRVEQPSGDAVVAEAVAAQQAPAEQVPAEQVMSEQMLAEPGSGDVVSKGAAPAARKAVK